MCTPELANGNPLSLPEILPRDNFTADSDKVSILKRESSVDKAVGRILYPIRPFHERYREYIDTRNRIFSVDSIVHDTQRRVKRSTLRLRNYFKLRKDASKYVISAIVNSPRDKRYYARVKFLDFNEFGLLDTGANVSCDMPPMTFPIVHNLFLARHASELLMEGYRKLSDISVLMSHFVGKVKP